MRFLHKGRVATVAGGSPPPPPPPPSPSATFVGTDTTTQGSWKGVYGANGYVLAETAAGVSSLPAGWSYTVSSESFFTYSGGFNIPAAECQKGDTSGVFTSVWFSATNWTLQITQTTAASYHLSVYLISAENITRNITITIKDGLGNVLDGPRAFSEPEGGEWARWQIFGTIQILFTFVSPSGNNAESQGVLIDP